MSAEQIFTLGLAMNTILKLISLFVLINSLPATGVLHPTLVNPQILRCSAGFEGDCSESVVLSIDGVTLVDVVPSAPPDLIGGRFLEAISIHCNYGSAAQGHPYSQCHYVGPDSRHAPVIDPRTCVLKSEDSWELTDMSNCVVTGDHWGHAGADAGGECVVFVQEGGWGPYYANTIYGKMHPDQLANSGSAYCQKPLPPDVVCDVILPPTLDHGVINNNTHSVIGLDGTVDCGTKPVITILGGSRLPLGPGVTTEITTQLVGTDRVRLTSTLDAINAEPGEHSGSVVVIASPY